MKRYLLILFLLFSTLTFSQTHNVSLLNGKPAKGIIKYDTNKWIVTIDIETLDGSTRIKREYSFGSETLDDKDKSVVSSYFYKYSNKSDSAVIKSLNINTLLDGDDVKYFDDANSNINPLNSQWVDAKFIEYDSNKTYNITRNEFMQELAYNYSIGDRGFNVLSQQVNVTYTINTDWLTQNQMDYLAANLCISPNVYIVDEDTNDLHPIVLTNSTQQVKTYLRESVFNLTLTFKYAFNVNTQIN